MRRTIEGTKGNKENGVRGKKRRTLYPSNKNPDYVYGPCRRPKLEARKAERGVGMGFLRGTASRPSSPKSMTIVLNILQPGVTVNNSPMACKLMYLRHHVKHDVDVTDKTGTALSSEKDRTATTINIQRKCREVWTSSFWATVCKTIRPICYPTIVLSVCLTCL